MKALLNPNLTQVKTVAPFTKVGASYYWSKEEQTLIRVSTMSAEIVYQEENEDGDLVYMFWVPKTQEWMEVPVQDFIETMEVA